MIDLTKPSDVSGFFATGFTQLDRHLGGLTPGALHVVYGYAASGKTAFMLSLALNLSRAGHSVVYHSLEMGREEVTRRLAAIAQDLPLRQQLQDPAPYYQLPPRLRIDDTPVLTAAKVRSSSEDVILIDYLQLMASTPQEQEALGSLLAAQAQQTRQVIVLSAQARSPKRDGAAYDLTTFAYNSPLDADTYVILGLEEGATADSRRLHILKNRLGQRGEVALNFNTECLKLVEVYFNREEAS